MSEAATDTNLHEEEKKTESSNLPQQLDISVIASDQLTISEESKTVHPTVVDPEVTKISVVKQIQGC